jgi:excisionase family DNA binding protein
MNDTKSHHLLLRPEEAAQRLAISRTVLFDLIATGEIDSVKIGRSRRIPLSALHVYVAALPTESSRVNSQSGRVHQDG